MKHYQWEQPNQMYKCVSFIMNYLIKKKKKLKNKIHHVNHVNDLKIKNKISRDYILVQMRNL